MKFFNQLNSDLKYHGGTSFYRKFVVFFFDFNYGLLFTYRLMKALESTPFKIFNIPLQLWQSIIYNSYISTNAIIGSKFKFAHAYGVIIGAAIIKDDVTIFQQVTIGSHGNQDAEMAWPTLEDGVKIYSGAKVIGKIVIGEKAIIGANCVIMKNIPANAVLVSPQGKIIGYNNG